MLSNDQAEALEIVCSRYLEMKKPTPRRLLVPKLQAPKEISELVTKELLHPVGTSASDEQYLPRAAAFALVGDTGTAEKAKNALTTALRILRHMYEVELEKHTFTFEDVVRHSQMMYGDADPDFLKLGLHLIQDFNLFLTALSSGASREIVNFTLAERISLIPDPEAEWDAYIERTLNRTTPRDSMSQDERERGKQIVEEMLKELCSEKGVTLGGVTWREEFDRMRYWLHVEAGDRKVDWPLSYEKLEDCVEDKGVRREVEAGLRQYVLPDAGVRGADAERPSGNNTDTVSGTSNADVFVSHATEDKPYVEPLVEALQRAGIQVWYDRITLEWGDDLRSAIDHGLANCRFGIVVFSKTFLSKKKWTEYEVNALFARERAGQKLILPIWHGITRDEVIEYSPAFADRLAKISSSDSYADIVVSLLALLGRAVQNSDYDTEDARKPREPKVTSAITHASHETKVENAHVGFSKLWVEQEGANYLLIMKVDNDSETATEITWELTLPIALHPARRLVGREPLRPKETNHTKILFTRSFAQLNGHAATKALSEPITGEIKMGDLIETIDTTWAHLSSTYE